ncbi:unnamed protein product [Mytilus coruscus]|uniref:R3H domain-containing protein n=1 Tax=Mytilus coruscus TaxID=42192 RepID=A0A6J8DWK2_MYTCO|nr:unnamed protein product [Mytilus coruscus]
MGVTRDGKDVFFYGYIEDELEELQHDIKEEVRSESKKRRVNRNRIFANRYDNNINYVCRKKTGAKQARRVENMKYLLNLNEKDDGSSSDIETDLFEPSVSHFAELFMEQEKMQIWNDFISSSEDEQQQFLTRAETKDSRKKKDEGNNNESSDLDETWEEVDMRSSHPGFSAKECFQKIDKNIKSFLKRRHVPMGVLESLERDLLSFFSEWPSSVYLSDYKSSFERMMLHALCQYLDLISSSYDENGNRRTQVENKHQHFLPPSPLLTQYLLQQRT